MFNVLAKDRTATERKLHIDILTSKEAYNNREVQRISWIPGTTNPADALTNENTRKDSPL